jgi:acyl-CoA synthetase (AMP-forming)/AMP-acid ligase II
MSLAPAWRVLISRYSDLAKSVDRLAAYYSSLDLPLPWPANEVPPEQVIAVLTSTAVDESLLEIALAKLGLCALLLSINNSVAAVAHLCKQTQATHLIYGTKYEAAAREAQALLKEEGIEVGLVAEKRFPLWGKGGIRDSKVPSVSARLTPEQEAKRTCVILHSSGSTGFPKPVFITHYGLIANMAASFPKTGFSALPLFHGFGHFSM